ncbi:MAG: hypothetical protein AAFV69_02600 [Pseudomonadota bacterium]
MSKIKTSSASTIGDRRDVRKKPGTQLSLPNDPLKIGLPSWVIQDGNYGDFKAGSRVQFALDFYCENLIPLEEYSIQRRSIKHVEDDQYRVVAQIVHTHAEWTVLDFGFLAYQDRFLSADLKVGDWVRGEISLSVDHFAYFERLSRQTNAPALIYTWQIDKIELLTAPWIQDASGLKRRDTSKWGWKEIPKTDAWKHNDGNAEYIFTCAKLSDEARAEFG